MSTLASERSWLLNPGLLKLVHQCRRLIHSEFGVKLHLTEDHLEQRLAEYAGKTRSNQLSRTWEALKEQVPQLSMTTDHRENPGPTRRMYRGQEVADAERPAVDENSVAKEDQPRKKKIIYRGQIIG